MHNYPLNKHGATKIKIGDERHNCCCFAITKISYLMLRIHHDLVLPLRYDICDTKLLRALVRNRAKATITQKKNQRMWTMHPFHSFYWSWFRELICICFEKEFGLKNWTLNKIIIFIYTAVSSLSKSLLSDTKSNSF